MAQQGAHLTVHLIHCFPSLQWVPTWQANLQPVAGWRPSWAEWPWCHSLLRVPGPAAPPWMEQRSSPVGARFLEVVLHIAAIAGRVDGLRGHHARPCGCFGPGSVAITDWAQLQHCLASACLLHNLAADPLVPVCACIIVCMLCMNGTPCSRRRTRPTCRGTCRRGCATRLRPVQQGERAGGTGCNMHAPCLHSAVRSQRLLWRAAQSMHPAGPVGLASESRTHRAGRCPAT